MTSVMPWPCSISCAPSRTPCCLTPRAVLTRPRLPDSCDVSEGEGLKAGSKGCAYASQSHDERLVHGRTKGRVVGYGVGGGRNSGVGLKTERTHASRR